MRPVRLTVKGFTAFRDEQAIDFSDLDLFVLTGPTGSGKSSLLDAMTYALFGSVDRVGAHPVELVSQGQPRMAVTLDFAVGRGTYRVTRTTTAKGISKVLLERQEGKDWVSYGEGADQIREVNRMVIELIGLDYDAFTRSVILPQGKFAQFLTGQPDKRREILTELLGLELFRRMSQRAGEISRNAKLNVETKQGVLDREYADVDETALKKAEADRTKVKKLLAVAEKNEAKLAEIDSDWKNAQTKVVSLDKCVREAVGLAERCSSASHDLDGFVTDLKGAHEALKIAEASVTEAKKLVESADTARAKAEKRVGNLAALNQLVARAESFTALTEELDEVAAEVIHAQEELAERTEQVKAAGTTLDQANTAQKEAGKVFTAAKAGHDAAHRADLVGALTTGLKSGDPCPICTRPLDDLPETDRAALDKAWEALQLAEGAKESAATEVAAAEKGKALADQALKTTKDAAQKGEKELARKRGRLAELEEQLRAALGSKVVDPSAEIAKRIDEMEELVAAEAGARDVLGEANEEVGRRKLLLERRERQISEIAVKLGSLPYAGLIERVRETDDEVEVPPELPDDFPKDPEKLAPMAAGFAKDLEKLAEDLEAAGTACRRRMEELLGSARELLPESSDRDDDLGALIAAVKADAKQLAAEAAAAESRAKTLAERLETRRRLEGEIAHDRDEFTLYAALGKELKSDRIVSYLQAEALRALAAAAGVHLRELSRTRYDLGYEDDRFYVIDAWNGNERRNVKTLSGGETFLASLALALALSEQVQHLAVTERERLESLFLDEGFGTLDPETLEAVVEGIEQLGRDGRLVGVITHVGELAERLPVRIKVTKSPRGSTVARDAELLGPSS